MILSEINSATCLTLDERAAEVFRIKKEWKPLGIEVEPFIVGKGDLLAKKLYNHIDIPKGPPRFKDSTYYPTWWKPNTYNAWLSHRKIFERFVKSGESKLLLLEDDCFVESDFTEILAECNNYLDVMGWDMLYLGGYHHDGSWSPTQNRHLIRLSGSGGFHSVIMKDYVVKRLLEFDPIGPYDNIAGRFLHAQFNCYAVYPSIVSQKDNYYSNIEGRILEKPDRYKR